MSTLKKGGKKTPTTLNYCYRFEKCSCFTHLKIYKFNAVSRWVPEITDTDSVFPLPLHCYGQKTVIVKLHDAVMRLSFESFGYKMSLLHHFIPFGFNFFFFDIIKIGALTTKMHSVHLCVQVKD